MPLYGQEINAEINPLEADLKFGLAMGKRDTIGIAALKAAKEAGIARHAISLASDSGRVPRTGCPVYDGDEEVGIVTSGGVSPTIERNIARALVRADVGAEGTTLSVEVRKKRWPMTVVAHPFYKRP